MLVSNMFTMWYSIMHRVPNGWGIQTMNTCLPIYAVGVSGDILTPYMVKTNWTNYLIGCLNFYLQAGNCFTSIAAK